MLGDVPPDDALPELGGVGERLKRFLGFNPEHMGDKEVSLRPRKSKPFSIVGEHMGNDSKEENSDPVSVSPVRSE